MQYNSLLAIIVGQILLLFGNLQFLKDISIKIEFNGRLIFFNFLALDGHNFCVLFVSFQSTNSSNGLQGIGFGHLNSPD
jgi:hypothetical protein